MNPPPMPAHSRLELSPGLWLDARRAIWMPEESLLAVSDLHLGYPWSHRASGNLLPVTADDGTIRRLVELVDDYRPQQLAVLGDVVHGFSAPAPVRDELRRLADALRSQTQLRLLGGNHDGWLPELLAEAGIDLRVEHELEIAAHLMLHGHIGRDVVARMKCLRESGGRVIFGHEHPSITLSAGVATSARCPCFLVAEDALVLPAFSTWAAGTDMTKLEFMSPFSHATRFDHAVAIVAGKLLKLPL
jgi:putative SbcD/Mre11-related phosphoesterase